MNQNENGELLSKRFSVFFVLIFILSACASVHKPSGYLPDSASLQKGKYFKQERVESGVDFSTYKKVKVENVELKYFDNSVGHHSEQDMAMLAGKFKSSLESELGKKFQVVTGNQTPDAETMVVAPALVYVATPERALNIATAWFIGFSFSKGYAAFEAKITDGATGKVIAEVAERRKGGGGIWDLKSIVIGGYMKFAHTEGAFKGWGKDLTKLTTSSK